MFRLIVALLALAVDDPWAKVRKLKSGTEIRVVKQGGKAPVTGKFDEARDDMLVLVVRNEQTAIPRAEIFRIDARPSGGGRVTKESKSTTSDPDASKPPQGPPAAGARGSASSSGSLSIGSKPDFETVYRRPPK